MDRRYQIFPISYQVLVDLFSGEGLRVIRSDLPEDAKFIDAHFDVQRRAFCAVYEHEDFPITPEGYVLPFADIKCWVERIENQDDDGVTNHD
jgi:hypothetical protein